MSPATRHEAGAGDGEAAAIRGELKVWTFPLTHCPHIPLDAASPRTDSRVPTQLHLPEVREPPRPSFLCLMGFVLFYKGFYK